MFGKTSLQFNQAIEKVCTLRHVPPPLCWQSTTQIRPTKESRCTRTLVSSKIALGPQTPGLEMQQLLRREKPDQSENEDGRHVSEPFKKKAEHTHKIRPIKKHRRIPSSCCPTREFWNLVLSFNWQSMPKISSTRFRKVHIISDSGLRIQFNEFCERFEGLGDWWREREVSRVFRIVVRELVVNEVAANCMLVSK